MKKMFFSSAGRSTRQKFWIAFACVSIFIIAMNALLRLLGPESMTAFFIALPFPFVAIYMLYCVYGKRLHDMGLTVRPFFIMLFLELLAVIFVMLTFGGAEYFAEFSQFDRKETIDPAIVQDIIGRYQAKMEANIHIINTLLMGIPALFTLWVGFAKSDPHENMYGPNDDYVTAFE